ncbi:nucleoside 2-deoxyribosyltransferase [Pseudooceanicola sp. CBS1P-1]|uniref:Nucleoside 2-deoxyribosyltransferase n=1 Tax=Pseudooceanicola albus TaxID=2692189 RepID=A0A6L7GBB7_9RHOB|nr:MULTISPECIES: nucleoside 2-deoxyribosyltransferase [Pseudooceanicola]MBT9386537.1 nucleoside 2-deoxyribosyltransferase [Pseudooceanicola endophyticus]MXN20570.1 nucleoside 2-deoxyribosyltransferase [Pseudooceanicola albus]
MRVYLAGPEVFLPDAREVLDRKIALTREAGLEPLAPGDLDEGPEGESRHEKGLRISRKNEALMHAADAIIANLTPFRGVGADPGTVYELGYMCGREKLAYGYTNVASNHFERLVNYYDGQMMQDEDGSLRGDDGLAVEHFDMADNLMLPGGIIARGGKLIACDVDPEALYSDLTAFADCLALLAARR